MLKKTPLNNVHRTLGARMVDFGGFDMPVQYTNVIDEHHTTRNFAGLFDISHMGEIFISGKDAFSLIQKVVSRDISSMTNGKIILAVMCNEAGGIIDDLTVYKFTDTDYLLVVNASTLEKDFSHIVKIKGEGGFDVLVRNDTDRIGKLDLQGPHSKKILSRLTLVNLATIKRYHFVNGLIDGMETIISRSGYTGEDGFELYFNEKYCEKIWNKILETGKDFGIKPIGLGARDTLRTEVSYMLYGNDIDENISPFETPYSWVVSFNKDFVGKEALLKKKEKGIRKKLVGFEMLDRGIARHGYEVYKNGEKIGIVTSGTYSPTLNKNIGMAYVPIEYSLPKNIIDIRIRKNLLKAKITDIPFLKK